jgi:hypothetical protein
MMELLTGEDVRYVRELEEAQFTAEDVAFLKGLAKNGDPATARRRALQLRDPAADEIKPGTLRITWISGIVAALAAAGSTWASAWEAIYGQDPSNAVKTAVLIAVVAAWAVIASVDIAARAYVSKKT